MENEFELTKICLEKWKLGLTLLNTLVLIGIAWWGYKKPFKNWLKQQKEERKLALNESKIEALKAVWGLLEYYTVKANPQRIITKEEKPKKYFLHQENTKDFIPIFVCKCCYAAVDACILVGENSNMLSP